MRSTHAILLAAAVGMTACAGTDINQPPIRYTATKALNERGTSSFQVVTYTKSSGSRKQVRGVPCTFAGDGFSSSFTTPAVVISPNMGGRTPVASVTCNLNGEKKTRIIEAYNETLQGINNGAMSATAGGGLVGLIVGGAVAAVQSSNRDVSQDVYGYPDVAITFGG